MTTRTSKRTVTFRRPFVLGGFDEVLPADTYNVESDEELLEGISFPAYRRTMAVIDLRAKSGHPGLTQAPTIDPNELDAALERDRAPTGASGGRDAHQEALPGATKERQEEADRQAVDRADDEGMILHPGQSASSRPQQVFA